jgi:hypothetical protein
VTGHRDAPASAPAGLESAAVGDHRLSDCVQDAAGDLGEEAGSYLDVGTPVFGPTVFTCREVLP